MKKLPLLALLLLLVSATGLIVWLARAGRAPSTPEVVNSTPAEEALSSVKNAPATEHGVELESDAASDTGPESDTRAEAATSSGETNSWDPKESVWLTGTVRGTCVDEGPVEVFGLSFATDAEAIARLATQRKKGVEGVRGAQILSRAVVGPDGRFRLAFPPETKTAHVSVFGKYSYLPDSQKIDVASTRDVVLTPSCGACIVGSIALPVGSEKEAEDVEGLEVSLGTSMEGMRGSVMNMDRIRRKALVHERAFEFRALPAANGYDMTIEPKLLAAARATQKDLAAGRPTTVEIALRRGASIQGVVHDAEGKPLADAKVAAALPGRWFGFDNKTVREVTSATDGTFELRAVTPGKIVLSATREKYLDSDPTKLDLADGALAKDVTLVLSQGKSVSGTVTWADGLPAAGVAIDLKFDMSQMYGMAAFNALRGAKGDAKSGADGSFVIGGLGEGPFTLEVETAPDAAHAPAGDAGATPAAADASSTAPVQPVLKGFSDALERISKQDKSTYWRARLDGVAGGTSNAALVLRAPEGVAGRVTDETGTPVAKFSVEANRAGKGPLASLGQEKRGQDFEDSGGNFLLAGLQEGHWKITAGAKGFARSDALEFDIPRKADAAPLVMALVHGASVKGVVRTPAGAPIADADVSIDNGKPNWQNMLDTGNAPPKAKSQPDGSFLIEGLRPGKTALYAKHKEFARSVPQSFDLAPAQVVEGAELVLREGGVLTGEVFADNGSPAVGMMVQASETKIFDQQMTFTDGRGKFEIEHLEPGTYQVVAMPTGNESSSADDGSGSGGDTQKNMMDMVSKMKTAMIDIKDGEKTHLVLGAPPADPVTVHGRVTHAGEPYTGSMLSFVREGKGRLNGMKTTQVDKDGSYSVKLDEPGSYLVSVQKVTGTAQQNAVEFPSDIPKDKDFKLDFVMPTARISGRVLGPDGEPAPGTRVSLHPESAITVGTMWGGQYTEMATDGEGRFDIQALRPGKYTMMVGGMMMGGLFGDDGGPGRQVKGDIRLSDGEWMKGVDFRLKKSGAIDVEVVDDAGAPVGEAALFARNKDGKLLDRFSMITTDSNGKCKYGGLEPGTYFVSARKGSAASPDSSQVRVEEGQRTKVKLVLQSGTILTVEVFDGQDKLAKASVSVQDEDGRDVSGMVALSEIMKMFSEGGFSGTEQKIGPLPPGKYRVRATLADGKTLTKPVTLSGQAERKLSIRFM